jgi:hypothetical protein
MPDSWDPQIYPHRAAACATRPRWSMTTRPGGISEVRGGPRCASSVPTLEEAGPRSWQSVAFVWCRHTSGPTAALARAIADKPSSTVTASTSARGAKVRLRSCQPTDRTILADPLLRHRTSRYPNATSPAACFFPVRQETYFGIYQIPRQPPAASQL